MAKRNAMFCNIRDLEIKEVGETKKPRQETMFGKKYVKNAGKNLKTLLKK